MSRKQKYRYIRDLKGEGFELYLLAQYVAHFWVDIMNGRVHRDGPNTLIKYSRDWEYPWVLSRSKVKPGNRVFDCGSGFSPLPFIWSHFGAEAHVIDKDAEIVSQLLFAIRSLTPASLFRVAKRNLEPREHRSGPVSSYQKGPLAGRVVIWDECENLTLGDPRHQSC